MRKSVLCLFTFIFVLFLIPVNAKAATTFTYGVSSVKVDSEKLRIAGWAYYTFINFCNSDNPTYTNYNMANSDGASSGTANKCSGKGYNSVKYRLFAKPKDGNKKIIYAKGKSGSDDNLRTNGISATCVNYYKPGDGIGNFIHCDGAKAPYGVFPDEPINYSKRNYNVQNNVSGFWEGSYFYDDIGFAGEFDLNELEDGETYTVYLEIEFNDGSVNSGKKYSRLISVPGVILATGGINLSLRTSNKVTIKNSFHDLLINYSPSVGTINQDAGAVYYKANGEKFKQYPYPSGGGNFAPGEKYNIGTIVNFSGKSVSGNSERAGGFDLYNLGTTGKFNEGYTFPGKNYTYYALATWLSYSGKFQITKTKVECGGTSQGSPDRTEYCKEKPSDYDSCCSSLVCGGTKPNTFGRTKYCTSNPNDKACCPSSGGNCPVETTDIIGDIDPDTYTFWDTSNTGNKESYYTKISKKTINNYPKYCSADDTTSTAFSKNDILGMHEEYNNAFCYQVGGFTTSSNSLVTSSGTNSPFSTYYLTYSGGNYKLNVRYETELVCVSLDNREVIGISVENSDGTCKASDKLDDSDIKWGKNDAVEPQSPNFDYYDSQYYYDPEIDGCHFTEACHSTPVGEKCDYILLGDGLSVSGYPECYKGFRKNAKGATVFNGYNIESLGVSEKGKFDITSDEVIRAFENVPTLKISDNTIIGIDKDGNGIPSDGLEFDVSLDRSDYEGGYNKDKVIYEDAYSNGSSDMKEYLQINNIESPLNRESYSVFTKAITVRKYIAMYKPQTITPCDTYYGINASADFVDDRYDYLYYCINARATGKYNTYSTDPIPTEIPYNEDNFSGTLSLKIVGEIPLGEKYTDSIYGNIHYNPFEFEANSGKQIHAAGTFDYFYEGWVEKTIYVTVKSNYKEQRIKLTADYTLPLSTISDRFAPVGGKWVSQINLSDYYQITVDSTSHSVSSGNKFGVAKTWNMDEALCALDLTDHDCDPTEETCACKYDKRGNLEKGVYYSDCLDFRVVSVTSLFPGKGSSLCVNPTSNCRQPGRNWLYVSDVFKKTTNFDYTEDTPMYHITLTPSTMNEITDYKDYYTDINLGGKDDYNPSKCTYNGNSRCSWDYESNMLNDLGSSVFTRNYDIINTRYRALKNMAGVNVYKTNKNVEGR